MPTQGRVTDDHHDDPLPLRLRVLVRPAALAVDVAADVSGAYGATTTTGERRMSEPEWEPGRWWRVLRDGEIWCETSSEQGAREAMEPGDVLQRMWVTSDVEWRTE